ncbi:MAG: serine hydrolase domain-containing protein [Candidatus Cybelea sp.]|jgi:D-alanyl-D-alanine carboxypeptidase
MKRFWLTTVALIFALSTTPVAGGAANAQLNPNASKAIAAAVNKELAAFGGLQPVPGAVIGVWLPGKVAFAQGFGYGNLSGRHPMALDDHFRIGSNTKTFVATVLLQLVDEKKLSLDDTIGHFHLGLAVPNEDRITLRQLAEMRSGIIDAYSIPAVQKQSEAWWSRQTPRHWVAIAARKPPLFAPGAKYNYSNTNWFLLGLIIEKVTHDTIEREIQNRILAPMALNQTSFPTTNWGMPAPYAHGYSLNAKKQWIDESAVLAPSVSWAAGAMISDMADMKRWVKAYVTGTTNSAASQRARLTCLSTGEGNLSFGLGIGCSAGWYGYTGGITGYNTGAYYMPATGATIIVLVNSQVEKPFPGVANAIFRDIAQIITPENVPFIK